jgi:hypothetical protein
VATTRAWAERADHGIGLRVAERERLRIPKLHANDRAAPRAAIPARASMTRAEPAA